ncbi:hypothetical protein GQ53DRAFT_749912 [Thozetella sp. PMI_491]|nr:hypothetical protein GQ53DRAFT_749912 [Thozetella sp. PMI_491]
MAAVTNDSIQHRASLEAKSFVEAYYKCVSENRSIANLYTTNSPSYKAINRTSDLNINGAVVALPEDYERILENQRRLPFGFENIRYVVDNWDYHIINFEFNMGAPQEVLTDPKKAERFMLEVMVSGTVLFGTDKDGPKKTFYESFTLVPNWEMFAKRGAPRNAMRYLVLSQNYRTI